MKNTQKIIIRILKQEEISISELSRNIEVSRSALSKNINHGTSINQEQLDKLISAYPEYFEIEEKVEKVKELGLKPIFKNVKEIEDLDQQELVLDDPKEKLRQLKIQDGNRHRNLNCHNGDYHMKVPYKYLRTMRPSCPVCGAPMLLKEEKRLYHKGMSLPEVLKKTEITELLKSGIVNKSDSEE